MWDDFLVHFSALTCMLCSHFFFFLSPAAVRIENSIYGVFFLCSLLLLLLLHVIIGGFEIQYVCVI